MPPRFLVVEGNNAADRAAYKAGLGVTASEAFAATLLELAPDARCDICFPADESADLPDASGLEGYDGVVITGSALNLYDGGPQVTRQVDLARAVFASGVPFFGSCWGLQVATAAAGGAVFRNPRGREIGVARNIGLTESGRAHPMLAGRPSSFDALCSHIDIVGPAPGATVLACNALTPVQAAEISFAGGIFWGVQYHPEFTFSEVAAIIERRAAPLAREGFFTKEAAALDYGRDLRDLDRSPPPPGLAWRLGVGDEILDAARRRTELVNFIDAWVRPKLSERGRA